MSPEDMEELSRLLSEFVGEVVSEAVREVLAEDRSTWFAAPDEASDAACGEPTLDLQNSGVVYFVRSEASNLVKIGYTTNLKGRLRALTNGSGGNIEVLHHVPGTFADERELHRLFAAHRKKGEWFESAEEILDYVRALRDADAGEAA